MRTTAGTMEEDLQRLREEALLSQSASPALLEAHDELSEFDRGAASDAEAPGPEWQLIDHRSLSQCGSSPRSLSHVDLGKPEAGQIAEDESAKDSSLGQFAASDSEHASCEDVSSESKSEDLTEPLAALSPVHSALSIDPGHELLEDEDSDDSSRAACDINPTALRDASFSPTAAQDPTGAEDLAAALLSGQSSYADISLPSGHSAQPHGDGASGSGPDDVIDLARLASLQSALSSELSAEYQAVPDTGVCTVVTGYPVDSPFLPASSGSVGDGGSTTGPLVRPSEAPPSPSSARGRPGSGAGSASSGGRPLGAPAGSLPREGVWARWMQSAGASQPGRVLRQIWGALQACAARIGAAIPPKLRARVQCLLQLAEGAARPGGGDRSRARLLMSALLGVSLLLALSCVRNHGLVRALRAREAELQHHILMVLDLNNKLTSAVDIPIARRCAYKASLSLSNSIF